MPRRVLAQAFSDSAGRGDRQQRQDDVKEMIASILHHVTAEAGGAGQMDGSDRVLATEGNLNNDIGVPLMLLRLQKGINTR